MMLFLYSQNNQYIITDVKYLFVRFYRIQYPIQFRYRCARLINKFYLLDYYGLLILNNLIFLFFFQLYRVIFIFNQQEQLQQMEFHSL